MSTTTAKDPTSLDQKACASQENDKEAAPRFSPDEEAALVEQAASHKATANKLFVGSQYNDAISSYQEALSTCPNYLHYDLAVLRSNLAACYVKLEQWKDAIREAGSCLADLDKYEKEPVEPPEPESEERTSDEESEVEEEIISEGAAKAGPAIIVEKKKKKTATPRPDPEELMRRRKESAQKIRAKGLMRRAKARAELGGWSNLSGAEEDYKLLSTMDHLGAADKKMVAAQLKLLPPKTKAAQEEETTEMWEKLKDLGNGILKPFGMSTDNFQMQKDENTGGYSMNFKQN